MSTTAVSYDSLVVYCSEGCPSCLYRSMLPDVVEESEIPYGVRREELFYAYFVFFTKFGAGITLGLSTALLELIIAVECYF